MMQLHQNRAPYPRLHYIAYKNKVGINRKLISSLNYIFGQTRVRSLFKKTGHYLSDRNPLAIAKG